MPTTPWCQFSPSATITRSYLYPFSSICFTAAAKIHFSSSCLFELSASISSAVLSAESISVLNSSSNTLSAFPILPAALIRGAIPKAILEEFMLSGLIAATFITAARPVAGDALSFSIPHFTILLFSRTSGITSAVTATLNKSAK